MKEEIEWLNATKVDNTTLKFGCIANTGDERSGKVTATIEEKALEITVTQKADTQPSFGDETIDDQNYVENVAINIPAFPAATGGNGTLTYSLTKKVGSGLPAGLSFDESTRVLSGTPTTVAGAATYVYTATDEDNDPVTLEFDITVEADVPTFGAETIDEQNYVENVAINIPAFPAATGGNGALTYSLTKKVGSGLPTGLSFDASTRVLSGTPTTVAGAATYVYTATDEDNNTVTLEFDITVEANVPPTFGAETIDDQTYVINNAINIPALPAATSGNGDLTYSLTKQDGSALPTWLMFAAETRMLSGTTPGSAVSAETYLYKVTDSDGDEAMLTFMIAVDATDRMPSFDQNDMIDDETFLENSPIDDVTLPAATGGNGTLTYRVTPALPAGLVLTGRVLSGTPEEGTAASAAAYTYTATDSDEDPTALTFMITIEDDLMPSFNPSDMIDDETYVEDSQIDDLTLPEAMGGNGTLTYSLTKKVGSGLPTGLILTGRVLSGTPAEGTAAGATAYTYTVTDADGDEATLTFMITIQDDLMPDFGSTVVAAQIYTVGAAITAVDLPAATPGNGTLTYSLTQPPGMDFDSDPANRRLSGAPNTVANATDYTLTVTDEDGDTDDLVFSVTVRAANATPITLLTAASLSVTASSTSNATTMLTSTVAWEAAPSVGWITDVDPDMEASTSTNQMITLTYDANTTDYLPRTGTVTFTETTAGANPKFSVTLTVTQDAAPIPAGMIPITHLEQLNAIRYDLNGDGKVSETDKNAYAEAFPGVVSANAYTGYELANDLDFSEPTHYLKATNQQEWTPNNETPPDNAGWVPIGTSSNRFTGTFDGGGNMISNLYINNTAGNTNLGLFGYLENSTIRNVGLVSPNVTGGDLASVGGLVGFQDGSTISNCYVSGGTIEGKNGRNQGVGGLVGYTNSSKISNCYVSGGTMKGGNNTSVGGLSGVMVGTMSACYVKGGSSTGGDDASVGGLTGNLAGVLSTCYVKGGSSTGGEDASVGGLVGNMSFGTIRACYVSSITAEGGNSAAKVGSLIGKQQAVSTLIASYAGGTDYTISISGTGSSGTVTNSYSQATSSSDDADKTVPAKTRDALITPTQTGGYAGIYADWNVDLDNNSTNDDPWDFGTNMQYPVLKVDFNNNGQTADDITAQRAP